MIGFPDKVRQSLISGVAKSSSPNVVEERENTLLIGGGGGYLHSIDKESGAYSSVLVTEKEVTGSALIHRSK